MIARLLLATLPWIVAAAPLAAAQPFDPFGKASIVERPGTRVPIDAPLTDSSGRPTNLRALAQNRPMLLVPVLHNCPNLCGVTLAGITDAVSAQTLRPGQDFALVALSIDPREHPGDAAADLARLRERPSARDMAGISALVGPGSSIAAITRAIGYRYAWDDRIGQYAHVAAVAVLTPQGRLAGWLYGLNPRPAAVRQALIDARRGVAGSWTDRLLLLCFHYDPETGRYTPAIEKLIRVAAFVTVAGLALLIWRMRGRTA